MAKKYEVNVKILATLSPAYTKITTNILVVLLLHYHNLILEVISLTNMCTSGIITQQYLNNQWL